MKESLESLEEYATEVIYDRRKGFGAAVLRVFLLGLSGIWTCAVRLRLRLYNQRYMRDYNLGCPVISIGNLTVGGTGKTPVVEMFARALSEAGQKVAILSRGYKSAKPPLLHRLKSTLTGESLETPPRIVSDGESVLLDSRVAGDEPYMLASNLPGVVVLVDKDRVKAGAWGIRHFGVDTLVLDDGLQYLRLKRRLDVVLVDSNAPFGTGYLLPRGTLREPAAHLRRAHYVFITKCHHQSNEALIARIKRYNKTAEIIECSHAPRYLQNAFTNERLPLETLRGAYLATMCGIAAPESFEDLLTDLGAIIEARRRFTDHHRYREQEVLSLMNQCVDRDLSMILTTEKDAVRLPKLTRSDVPIFFLRVEIEILSGQDIWKECIHRLCSPKAAETSVRHFA